FIGHFGNDVAYERSSIGVLAGIALTLIQLYGDGQVARLGVAAADVPDMFVQAEDFLYDQHHWWRWHVGRRRIIRGYRAVESRHLRLPFAQATRVGMDGTCSQPGNARKRHIGSLVGSISLPAGNQ